MSQRNAALPARESITPREMRGDAASTRVRWPGPITIEHIWLAMPVAIVVCFALMNPLRLLDFWWHLKAGEIIFTTGSIPEVDLFSFTRAWKPFALQNWLADPPPESYAEIFRQYADRCGAAVPPTLVEWLLERHRAEKRPLRSCEPRDLIERARDFCHYSGQPLELSEATLELAWKGYSVRPQDRATAPQPRDSRQAFCDAA